MSRGEHGSIRVIIPKVLVLSQLPPAVSFPVGNITVKVLEQQAGAGVDCTESLLQPWPPLRLCWQHSWNRQRCRQSMYDTC